MRSRKRHGRDRSLFRAAGVALEGLEARRLLSGAGATPCQPYHFTPSSATVSGTVAGGYTPSQVRHAYGFDQVGGDGTGQTIAIVDAFKHPNIVSDLNTFDARFNLARPPSFSVVGQSGGSVSSLRTNGAWASETALDVEWAHAMAPNASLLLVETNTDTIPDLMAGVNYARNVAGVSAIAMSWGGGEFRGQLNYDNIFTTPAGHAGITFLAAAGDVGSSHGPNWPASSPSVVSVGGTTLYTKSADGTYSQESGWRNTTGGASRYERRPAWQANATSTLARSSPDVSYDANPSTGFAIYSSVNDGGIVGWSSIAGTSAGVPQWAAQVVIANQLRAASGQGPLDGGAGTLPTLYQLYTPPQPGVATSYTASFNDINVGRTSSSRVRAGTGYDTMTGLGTPKVPQIITALTSASNVASQALAAVPVATVGRHGKPSAYREHDAHPSTTQDFPSDYSSVASNSTPANPGPDRGIDEAVRVRASRSLIGATSANSLRSASLLTSRPINAMAGRSALLDQSSGPTHRFSFTDTGLVHLSGPVGAITHLPVGFTAWAVSTLADFAPVFAGTSNVSTGGTGVESLIDANGGGGVLPARPDGAAPSTLAHIFDFDRPQAVSTFADAMADFAYESTALGSAIAVVSGSHGRAWAVTFTVIGVDMALIACWRNSRRSKRRPTQSRLESDRYSLTPV